MSIQSEINRIVSSRDQSFQSVRNKGVVVPNNAIIDDLPGYIDLINGVGAPVTVSGNGIVSTPDDNKTKWVRSISITIPYTVGGISSLIVTRSGENMFPTIMPYNSYDGSYSSNGVIGSASSTHILYMRCKQNTDYCFKHTTRWAWRVGFFTEEPKMGDTVSYKGTMTNRTALISNSGSNSYIVLSVPNTGFTNAEANETMITESSTVPSSFIPWSGDEWSISFPTTIFGGTLNCLTGELIATYDSAGTPLTTPISFSVKKIFPTIADGVNYISVNLAGASISMTYVPVAAGADIIADEASVNLKELEKERSDKILLLQSILDRSIAGAYKDGEVEKIYNQMKEI